ncbi:MAG: hydrogenase nickel incorporation protein HypB [Gemmataceae bacterium]
MDRLILPVGMNLKAKNNAIAAENRSRFEQQRVYVLNVMSSPGAGKTALLERTLFELLPEIRGGVVVGDLATENDAIRLRRSGAPAVQITTGTLCHLEAAMVARACEDSSLQGLELLFVENVGNLVCPATYDLGESLRMVVFSVTEGEDKPLKYPTAFRNADVVILSKMDLAGPAGFDRPLALENIRKMAPQAKIFELSSRTGEGLESWYDYLRQQVRTLSAS